MKLKGFMPSWRLPVNPDGISQHDGIAEYLLTSHQVTS